MTRLGYALLWLAAGLGCRASARHRERASEPVASTPDPVVPADASAWAGDTLAWPAGERSDSAPLGTEHPVRWAIGDPKRRWAVLCDQREDTNGNGIVGDTKEPDVMVEVGDVPALYLVIGSGPGKRVDALYADSPTGDHLVVGVEGAIALVDADTHVVRRLPGARPHAVFSGDGKRLVYLADSEIVRRELATGGETRVPVPAGEPVLMDLDTSGRWLVIAMARRNGRGVTWLNGDWPRVPACALGMQHVGVDTREPVEKVWIDLDHGGAVRDDQSIVRLVGEHVLAQPALGELVLDGKRLSPADCARVETLGVHESPLAVLIGCIDKDGKSRVELLGGAHVRFPANLTPIDAVDQLATMVHERELCPVPDHWCVDLVTGARRKTDFVWYPAGVHDGEAWYGGTRTHLLVGAPEHGPLHWRAQRKEDLP